MYRLIVSRRVIACAFYYFEVKHEGFIRAKFSTIRRSLNTIIFSHSIKIYYNSYRNSDSIMMLNYLIIQFNETFNNLCHDYILTNNIHGKR